MPIQMHLVRIVMPRWASAQQTTTEGWWRAQRALCSCNGQGPLYMLHYFSCTGSCARRRCNHDRCTRMQGALGKQPRHQPSTISRNGLCSPGSRYPPLQLNSNLSIQDLPAQRPEVKPPATTRNTITTCVSNTSSMPILLSMLYTQSNKQQHGSLSCCIGS